MTIIQSIYSEYTIFKINKIIIIIILIIIDFYLIYPFLKNNFVFLKIYIYRKFFHKLLIEFDISMINSKYGPGIFIKGINNVLPFNWGNCFYISSSSDIKKNFIPDLFIIPRPFIGKSQFENLVKTKLINKLVLGPIFVPKKWNTFPNNKVWKEKNFLQFLNLTRGIAVHSFRVRDYIINKTNTNKMIQKYIIVRACTNLKPTKIKKFSDRKIDILFFEKYADLNRQKQGQELLNMFKNTSKNIASIKYGSYNKNNIKKLAEDSKFIIYFSFFDTGAIGLKEIQNYGVITFTHQKEFIIDNEFSFYIPEMANLDNIKIAFIKIMNVIERISNQNIQTELIARKNQLFNKCENALIDLCKSLN